MTGWRVALATCDELPDLDPDERLLIEPLARRGVAAEPAVWDEPGLDWAAYDLVVIRSTWDYAGRRGDYLSWAESLPRLANAADVVRWNTDKTYLSLLAAAELPVIPTTWVSPSDSYATPDWEHVVKPAVSAGAKDTARYAAHEAARSLEHVAQLQAAGRHLLVQPYLATVDTIGETAQLFFAGGYSHAVRKGPILLPGRGFASGLYAPEDITARVPSGAEREVAEAVLDALPFDRRSLLYARVDLVPGPEGDPTVIEVELTEPSLFLAHHPGAADRFADAIVARLGVG